MDGRTALAICVLWAGSVQGQGGYAGTAAPPAPRAWTIAPEVSLYRYKEPGVMTNEGTLYGVVGSYTFHRLGDDGFSRPGVDGDDLSSWSTIRLEGRLGFGEVDYDGSFMDGTPLSTSGTDDLLIDARFLWGREWRPVRFVHAAYVGLGYRYLNDDSSEQLGGYERESNYLYVPLGARRDFDLAGRWDLGLTGEFDVLIVGRQISHLDDVDPELPTVRNWQWPGFGAAVSVELRHRSERFDLALAPFLRYWWVAESDLSRGYYEPENNTVEYGLSFIIRF